MYRSLQTCRAVAAILVVLYHLGSTLALWKYYNWPLLGRPFSFAYSGVYFFFVLSGFIICFVHRQDIGHPERLKNYLLKRAIRIYPAYWLIFFGVFFATRLAPSLANTSPYDLSVLIKSAALMPQGGLTDGVGFPVLAVGWTLQYEVLFYLGFAILILNRTLGICVWLTVVTIHFLLPEKASFPLNYIEHDWILLFLLGAATARLADHPARRFPPILLAVGGALLFFSIGIHESFTGGIRLPGQTYLYGVCSCLIIYGLVQAEKAGTMVGGGKLWQLLGAASYVLYLIHFPIIGFFCKICLAVGLRGHSGALIAYFLLLALCLMGAVLFHRLIEAPLLRWLSRWTKTKKDGQPLQEVRAT